MSTYGRCPAYHASLDDLEHIVTPGGQQGGLDVMKDCITLLEANQQYRIILPGEPEMGRRGLYPTTSTKRGSGFACDMMNVIAYCDSEHDNVDLGARTSLAWKDVVAILKRLEAAEVVAPDD